MRDSVPHLRRISEKEELLRNHSLFRELPPLVLERIGSYSKRRTVPKGSIIFEKGDTGVGLIGVLSGSVKISVASADGRDVVLNIIRTGEVFGEIALLDGQPRTADATAISDCELLVIERRDFIPFLRTQPDVMLKLMEILCSRLRKTSEQVHEVTFLSLSARLAKTLVRLTKAANGHGQGGAVTITQREISQIVGRSRESTNKQLRQWERSGWIRLKRGSICVLKPEQLAMIATKNSDID
jgi:CRP/FNR family transcriptional regulator, cyclic AMP receptor protein